MKGDDFDEIFAGRSSARPTFAERVGGKLPIPAGEPDVADSANGYKAFGFTPTAVGESCDVQRWMDGTDTPEGVEFQYRFLLQIGYVGDEMLKLFLPDCIIVIEGKNLRDLRKKIARRQVTYIAQFSPLVWPKPSTDKCVIEQIEIVQPKLAGL